MSPSPTVTFIPIAQPEAKLRALIKIARHCFDRKTRLLFAVPSLEAAQYIDTLLWRSPEESFIPHLVCSSPTNALIAISPTVLNVNQASILFNLRPEAHPLASLIPLTYEFFDSSQPIKLEQALQRKAIYLNQKLIVK